MLDWAKGKLLELVLPVVLGPIGTALVQWAKRSWAWLDTQPAWVKQVVVGLYALGTAALSEAMQGAVCVDGTNTCDPEGLAFKAILTWAVALAVHGWKPKGK